MTRFKISIGIIIVLLGMSIFSGEALRCGCRDIISRAEMTAELIKSGDSEAAAISADSLERKWKSFRNGAAFLIHNSKLSELDRLCTRIRELSENEDDEALAELAELRELLEKL